MRFIPIGAFTAFCLKSLVISPSLYEVLAITATAALSALFFHIENVRQVEKHVQEQNRKIDEFEKTVKEQNEIVEGIRSGISQLRLASNMRVNNVQNR